MSVKGYIDRIRERDGRLANELKKIWEGVTQNPTVEGLQNMLNFVWNQRVANETQLRTFRGRILDEFVGLVTESVINNNYFPSCYISNSRKVGCFIFDLVVRRNTDNAPLVIIECKVSIDPNFLLATAMKFHLVKNNNPNTRCFLVTAGGYFEEQETMSCLPGLVKKFTDKEWIDYICPLLKDEDLNIYRTALEQALREVQGGI